MWSINSNKRCCLLKSCKICDDKKGQGEAAGLRILTKIGYQNEINSNVVIKPIIFLGSCSSSSSSSNSKSESDFCSYLKCCHLCHKHLPLDKEIYMYRGDLGFCSVECRERQIYLDEIHELSTTRNRNRNRSTIFSSFRCELSEDFGHPFSSHKTTSAHVLFS